MKKSGLMAGLLVAILSLSIATVRVSPIQAQTREVAEKVNYYLPYPGILPDHPLYWLKMGRDRIQLWLTTDSLAKAEKLLAYADKRLGAGWALIDGNKPGLGVTTLTKAEKYLDQAIIESQKLEDNGEAAGFREKLNLAIKKHREVLEMLAEKTTGSEKEVVKTMVEAISLKDKPEAKQAFEVSIKVDFGTEVAEETVKAKTVLEALEALGQLKSWQIKVKTYDFGSLVEEVNGKKNTTDKAWIYFINDKSGEVAADKQELKAGDAVEWRYIKPEF